MRLVLVPGGKDDVPRSRRVRRSPRQRHARARTESVKQMEARRAAMERAGIVVLPLAPTAAELAERPRVRADCADGPRPCPWAGCKYHLGAEVSPVTGSVKVTFPDLEVDELAETCVLDVADRGGITLEETGDLLNITRERVRQLEVRAFSKIAEASPSVDEVGVRAEAPRPRVKKKRRRRRARRKEPGQRAPVTCGLCGDEGHNRRTCPRRQQIKQAKVAT